MADADAAAAAPSPLKRARADEDGAAVDAEKRALQEKVAELEKQLEAADTEKKVLALALHHAKCEEYIRYEYRVDITVQKWVEEGKEGYRYKSECECDKCTEEAEDREDEYDKDDRYLLELHRRRLTSFNASDLERFFGAAHILLNHPNFPDDAKKSLKEWIDNEKWRKLFGRDFHWGSRYISWKYKGDVFQMNIDVEQSYGECKVKKTFLRDWNYRTDRFKEKE